MKRIIFITCLACFSSFFSLKASAHPPIPTIPLKGALGGGPVRTPCVVAYLYATGVEVVFNINLGSLTVEVINEHGDTAFQTTVNAVANGTLPIDTSGWASGEYTLVIMDGQGGYLEGNFLIN